MRPSESFPKFQSNKSVTDLEQKMVENVMVLIMILMAMMMIVMVVDNAKRPFPEATPW